MHVYGIGERVCGWIRDWLSDRTQRVVFYGDASDWIQVTTCVAQTSVLGHTPF